MRFGGVVIAVRDLAESRRFYEALLGQRVRFDFGENIAFEGGLSLQLKPHFARMVGVDERHLHARADAGELFFETRDLGTFLERLERWSVVEQVQACFEQAWGQRVIRLRDPDGHLIEVGEAMEAVVDRLLSQGLDVEEVSRRSQMPVDFVRGRAEALASAHRFE